MVQKKLIKQNKKHNLYETYFFLKFLSLQDKTM